MADEQPPPPTKFNSLAPYAWGFVGVLTLGIFYATLTMKKPARR
jgi:hypothetical protein